MRAMITGSLIGASVFLFIRLAQANPIDDCNQSDDAEKQIDGCSEFLQLDPFSPFVALAYGGVARPICARAILPMPSPISSGRGHRRRPGQILCEPRPRLSRERDLDRAIADFSKAIELDSKFGEALINRCVVYEDKWRPISPSPIALPQSPSIPKTRSPITIAASLGRKQGRSKTRSPTTAPPSSSTPAIATLTRNRAVLYDHKGEKELAIADYRAALAKNFTPQDRKDLEAALQRLDAVN